MENKKKKVLAIDDNGDNLITVTALIRELFPDIEVVTALSGREGIDCARRTAPDVILLDILMPGMDGYEVCRELKADFDLREIPVVFLTALKADSRNRIRALEAGADGFLNKPIDESELAAQIRAMLRIRAANVKVHNDLLLLAQMVEERTETLEKELDARKKTERELRFATRRLNAFWEIARLQNSSFTAICDHLLASIVAMTESEYGFFGFMNEDETVMTIYSWSGETMAGCGMVDKPTVFPVNEAGVWGEAVRLRSPLIINDYTTPHSAKKGLPEGHVPLKRLLVIPVFSGSRIVSVAAVADRAYEYVNDDIQQITAFVENMQLIIDRKRIEVALEASEDRYRRIAEGITDYIYSVKIQEGGVVSTVHSAACEKVTGYTAKEFEDDQFLWINMVPADEREGVVRRAEEIISGKQVAPLEHHIMRKDGKLRWVSDTAILNKDTQGEVLSYEGVVKDITESKVIAAAQTFLLHSGHPGSGRTFFESLARYLSESLDMEHVRIDRLEGDGLTARTVAVYNNGTFDPNISYVLKDTPCGEVVGRHICCFPDDVCRLFPKAAILKELKAESYIGATLWSYDAQPIGLIAAIGRKPLKNPELNEKLIKLVAIRAAGELERQQSDEQLRISEEKFRTMFDQSPYGIALIDSHSGKFFEVNSRFAQIAGRSVAEMAATDWMHITHPDDIQEYLDNMALMNSGRSNGFTMKKRYLHTDGSHVWIRMTIARLIVDENEAPRHLCMIEDITELRNIEARLRQSEKMEAVGTLAGGIAHDFNNVLGGIIGFTDMSLDYVTEGSPLEKNLRKVLKAADRAKHLVRQILTFSRQSNRQQSLTPILPIVNEALELLRASIPSSVHIQPDLRGDTKPVFADPTEIHEVIINLATNAVYAMKNKGTLTVRLYTVCRTGETYGRIGVIVPGEYVVIEIADTGSGMDSLTIQKVFEPFFTTKPIGEGTGMGLAVVLGVIRSHHGDLQVESEPGKGTTFRIFLPVSTQSADAGIVDKENWEGGGSERILFVDDEKELVEIAEEMLGGIGYHVTGFTSSPAAQKYIKEKVNEFDILVTDQTMPGITGMELAAVARNIRPDLPVILCTGYSRDATVEKVAEMGNSRLVMKPYFGSYDIGRAIRELMDSGKKGVCNDANTGN